MKPKDEVIKQAQAKLEKVEAIRAKKGRLPISHDDYDELMFIVTGEKRVKSPIEPYDSNRSFFHLKEVPCTLKSGKNTEEGLFTHEDYALFYELKRADGSAIYLRGGASFKGEMTYEEWKPKHLYLWATEAPTTRELIIANGSLTSSCL
jgi:hypothetical protein